MSGTPLEAWLHITAGKGPVECAWAVIKVLECIRTEAGAAGFEVRVLEVEPGPATGTANSAVLVLTGRVGLGSFLQQWNGTVQWIGQSTFRPQHKRKNWFVGVEVLTPVSETEFDAGDVRWDTMRAAGPGGQHVNRTESAVRVTHIPTGIQVTAMEERSQHRNRKLAMARLAQRLAAIGEQQRSDARKSRWQSHQTLERGNPIRVLRE